jgi:hypothetical protein
MYNNAIGFHKCFFVALNQQFAGAERFDKDVLAACPENRINESTPNVGKAWGACYHYI